MKVLKQTFGTVNFLTRKERKGKPQRTLFSLCALLYKNISGLLRKLAMTGYTYRHCELAKQSRQKGFFNAKQRFYFNFPFYNGKSLLCENFAPFAVIAIAIVFLFSCGEPLMEYEINTSMPVVECYLIEGSDSINVSVYSMEEFLKDDVKLSRPISQLNVTVNQTVLTEISSGKYALYLKDDSIREGQTYNLQFSYKGKSIEATTTIPSPIRSLAVEPQSLEVYSSYWGFSDTTQVVVSWDDPDNSFYQVYIESPNNPEIPSMGVFRRRMMQPFQGNSYRISSRELRSVGIHTIYVYRVGKDYAELYERVSASDLANPVSYIQNAFGIFTSLSVAGITVRVYQAG